MQLQLFAYKVLVHLVCIIHKNYSPRLYLQIMLNPLSVRMGLFVSQEVHHIEADWKSAETTFGGQFVLDVDLLFMMLM